MSLKRFFITYQIPASLLLLGISGCAGGPTPKWDGKLWASDSARGGITRAQENRTIRGDDPEIDEYLAMTYADFRAFYATYVLGCKEWKPGLQMMSAREALKRFEIVVLDLQREAAEK